MTIHLVPLAATIATVVEVSGSIAVNFPANISPMRKFEILVGMLANVRKELDTTERAILADVFPQVDQSRADFDTA